MDIIKKAPVFYMLGIGSHKINDLIEKYHDVLQLI